jgi:hypothetical protein
LKHASNGPESLRAPAHYQRGEKGEANVGNQDEEAALQAGVGRLHGRGIDGYSDMAADFVRAGYPEKMYPEKIRGWVNINQCVADTFFLWLGKTYDVSAFERDKLMDALGRDVFGP